MRVTAPPEGGKANAAACRVVASALHLPKSAVRVIRGDTSRHKTLEVDGAEPAQIALALGEPDARLL